MKKPPRPGRLRYFINNLSLQTTILVALLAGLLLPVAIMGVLDVSSQRRVLLENLDREHERIVRTLAFGLQSPVWDLEPASGEPLVAEVMKDPRIVSVRVTTPLVPNFLAAESPSPDRGELLTKEYPVLHGNEKIGSVSVQMSAQQVETEITNRRNRVMFALLLQVAISAAIVMSLLHDKVVGPIRELSAQSKRLAGGELQLAGEWDRTDEVGILGRSMDDMRRSLLQSFSALEESNVDLKESEALNSGTIRNALDCIIMSDSDGRIIEFNPAAQKTFGYARNDVVGKLIADMIVPPHLRERHAKGLARYRASGQGTIIGRRIEIEAMKSDGTLFPVEIALSDLSVGTRRVFAAFIRDLSEQKEAEQEIARQREALYQSEKLTALGSLLAGVAHELNNPLSVVVGQAVLLQEATTDPKYAERAGKIRRAADRCARIVKTFLAMARSRPPETTSVRINEVITSCVDLVAYPLRSSGVEVSFDLDPDLPAIRADADQIGNVFTNLIVNAQQALMDRDGGRRLRITSRPDPAGNAVHVEFADNGPGIKPEIRSRIFEPFFTTKPTGIGTGIGLSLCHGILRSHGGKLELADTPGGGATFIVTLPLASAPAGAAEVPVAAKPSANLPCSVLIVDDEPEIADTIADILRADGHAIQIAHSGRKALALLDSQNFEIILSDLRMPDMDGPALYRGIAERKPHLTGRVAFITGDTLGRDVEGFLKEVGAPYLEKPFLPEDVKRLVAEVLRNGAAVTV